MDAFAFLSKKTLELGSFYVLAGDEPFLKRLALARLRKEALGADDEEGALSSFDGEKAEFAEVWDEYESLPFFAPKRVVIVETADKFVTQYRGYLEKKIDAGRLPASGVMILDVKTWPANTRLAKMVDASATIVCKAQTANALPKWACEWAASQHKKKMPYAAGELLVDQVGLEMGLIDQEILKLAMYVGDRDTITPEDVDKLVGNSRAENIWKIFGLIASGNSAEALRLLQRALEKGEEPMKLAGAFGSHLRKLAQAAHFAVVHKMTLGAALAKAGIKFNASEAEAQLKRLSRQRALKLYEWLVDLNLDLRGNSPLDANVVFERFLLRLAAKA